MHLATYSKGDAGRLLAHYDRSIGERDHIDRDGEVYNLAPDFKGGCHARFAGLCRGLDIGAKTRPLADLVVTQPEGFAGDTRAFFEAVYGFLCDVVGEGRVVSAYVHLDEPGARPHMHFAFVPVVEVPVMTNDKTRPLRWTEKDEEKNSAHRAGDEKRDSKGTVRYERVPLVGEDGKPVMRRTATASKLISRKEMKELHPRMEKHLCKVLGVPHVGIKLDEGDRRSRDAKKLSALDHEDYVRVTAEIERTREEAEDARSELAEVREQLVDAEIERDSVRNERDFYRSSLRDIKREMGAFEKRYREIVEELTKIAEALSVRKLLDRFRDKLVEFASSKICRDALDAGGAFKSRRDGRRAEKVLEEGARTRVGELEALGSEMRAWSPFDEIGELRRASKDRGYEKANGIYNPDLPSGGANREQRG